MVRFSREEAAAVRRDPRIRELVRRVKSGATVEVDTNSYSVPWQLIGETVAVTSAGGRISVRHGGGEVASYGEVAGRRQRVMVAAHLEGVAALSRPSIPLGAPPTGPALVPGEAELLRPLSEYEKAAGEPWS